MFQRFVGELPFSMLQNTARSWSKFRPVLRRLRLKPDPSWLGIMPRRKVCRSSGSTSTIVLGSVESGVLNRFVLCDRSRNVMPPLRLALIPNRSEVYERSVAIAPSKLRRMVFACA